MLAEGPTVLASSRPRIVLDTNVCLDLFVFHDHACAHLDAALRDGAIIAVTSEGCRGEWQRVLHYPALSLDDARHAAAANAFDACVTCLPDHAFRPRPGVLPRCADADDQKFLELALQASAVALITRDDALLVLGRRTERDGLFAILTPQAWAVWPGTPILPSGHPDARSATATSARP